MQYLLESAIHWITNYTLDNSTTNYPPDSTIYYINQSLLEKSVGFGSIFIYSKDGDCSAGWHYLALGSDFSAG